MKDRIEVSRATDKRGRTILKFYVHCDLGLLYLFEKKYTPNVSDYFGHGKSVDELLKHKYRGDDTVNKIVDRIPAYIKYAKAEAAEVA